MHSCTCIGLVIGWLALGGPAGADPHPADDEMSGPFSAGGRELALSLGVGRANSVGGGGGEVEEAAFVDVRPRFGLALTDPLGPEGARYQGNLELLAEGEFLFNTRPQGGFATGATLLLRYNLSRRGRWVPFVELGAGALYLDFDIEGQDDGLNFSPQGGVGVHFFTSERTAVTAAYRFHHISNADIGDPNLGINSNLFQLGFSYFLR